jgi:acetolactate synthase I/II/III large subunit
MAVRRVADVIVSALEAQGIGRVYCVPGESYLALLDALHGSSIEVIVCRHESGAAFMAVAEAKMTGKAACAMVSRGPGATNAAIAFHVAEQDAVPLVLLIGQVSREERGRGAFQEVDYTQFFGGMAKGVWEVNEAAKMGETLAMAFHRAQSGTPGPVAISLPEDLLKDEAQGSEPAPFPALRASASTADADAVLAMLAKAERPLVIAGAAMRGPKGAAALARFARAHHVPVATTWKNQDVFDNYLPFYAGHLGFGNPAKHRELLAGADLIIAVGTRLGDVASQNYQLPRAPEPAQPLIHIYGDAAPIGRVFRTALGVVADPVSMLDLLAEKPTMTAGRKTWVESIKGFMDDFMGFTPRSVADGVDFGTVVAALSKLAPSDAVITTDSGNVSTWLHRHWRLTPRNTLLGAIGGAMGFGVPGGVAAAMQAPERMVITFVGDGGILMTGQELATAMQYGVAVKIILSDNGSYGTIRTHQEKHYPARISGTELANPDFAAWARSFGAQGVTVARGDDVEAKVAEVLAHKGSSVLHVKSSRESLSAFTTLSALAGK